MQAILFVSSESIDDELDAYGGEDLRSLRRGDVVWLLTRMPSARGTPAICGRLTVAGVEPHDPADRPMEHGHARARYRVAAESARSERCDPFPCDVVHSWPVWRAPFEGAAPISDEQAACLETYWAGAQDRRVRRRSY